MDLGDIEFEAWFHNASFLPNGDMKLILTVPKRSKAAMLPITDLTGVRFQLSVTKAPPLAQSADSIQRPTVSQLKAGISPQSSNAIVVD